MDKQGIAIVKNGGKILIWLGLLIFFIYSYQAIIDLEGMGHPRRQESVIRILTALAQPNLLEYEYETRETLVVLERSCQNPNGASQTGHVSDRTIVIDLECPSAQRTIYTIHGSGFRPNTTGYIVWKSNTDNENRKFTRSDFLTDNEGNFSITFFQIDLENVTGGRTIIVIEQLSKTFRGFSEISYDVARKLWETIQIAFLSTVIGTILAIPFTFFSARPSSFWGRGFNILLQPILSIIRAVHPLIFTIPAIVLAGIGPTAGVLALTLFSTAILIVNFSEYAQEHTSLSWPVLFKVHFPGIVFKHFPVNILIATVLGFMGGGGVGFLLQQDFSLLNYSNAGVAIFAIIISIGSLDLLSRAVWYKIQHAEVYHLSTPEKEELPQNSNTPLTPR